MWWNDLWLSTRSTHSDGRRQAQEFIDHAAAAHLDGRPDTTRRPSPDLLLLPARRGGRVAPPTSTHTSPQTCSTRPPARCARATPPSSIASPRCAGARAPAVTPPLLPATTLGARRGIRLSDLPRASSARAPTTSTSRHFGAGSPSPAGAVPPPRWKSALGTERRPTPSPPAPCSAVEHPGVRSILCGNAPSMSPTGIGLLLPAGPSSRLPATCGSPPTRNAASRTSSEHLRSRPHRRATQVGHAPCLRLRYANTKSASSRRKPAVVAAPVTWRPPARRQRRRRRRRRHSPRVTTAAHHVARLSRAVRPRPTSACGVHVRHGQYLRCPNG